MSVDIERIRKNVEMAGWTDPNDIFELIQENAQLRERVRELEEGLQYARWVIDSYSSQEHAVERIDEVLFGTEGA